MDNPLLDADERADSDNQFVHVVDDDFVESGSPFDDITRSQLEDDEQSADPLTRLYNKHLAHRLAPALGLLSRVCTLRCMSLVVLLTCVITVVLMEIGFDDESVQACTLRAWWQYKQHRTLHFSLATDYSQAPAKAAVIAAMLVSMLTWLGTASLSLFVLYVCPQRPLLLSLRLKQLTRLSVRLCSPQTITWLLNYHSARLRILPARAAASCLEVLEGGHAYHRGRVPAPL